MRKQFPLFLGFALVAAPVVASGTIELPDSVVTALGGMLAARVVSIGKSASLVVMLMQALKFAALYLGYTLEGRKALLATAGASLLGALAGALKDGTIGGDDWKSVVSGVLVFAAAAVGYKLLLSTKAKNKLALAAKSATVQS